MEFRHEVKHEINMCDRLVLKQRLQAVMHPDEHSDGGKYFIRSLYFDNITDKALREKLDGVNKRDKFRIRYYNNDSSFIRLEKKSKQNGLCSKIDTALTPEQAEAIVQNDIGWMAASPDPLIARFYTAMRNEGLRARTIVDYTREAFVFAPGNVRVTLDYDIRTGLFCTDFLNPDCVTLPVPDNPSILEVKWDEFLPSAIIRAVSLEGRRQCAFSKYAACRAYM